MRRLQHGFGGLGSRGEPKGTQEMPMGPKHLNSLECPAQKFSPMASWTLGASDQQREGEAGLPLSELALDSDYAVGTAANLAAREVLQRQHKSRLSTS